MKPFIHKLSAVVLACLLAACATPAPLPPTVTQPPTETPVPPTASPIPPTTTPMPTPVNGLTELHMFSNTAGWALISDANSTNSLLHTTDGGQSWTDITPPDLPADVFGSFFLDAQSAWVYDYNSPTNGLVHTADGGKTWTKLIQSLPTPPDFMGGWITFVDESHGWLESISAGAGHGEFMLFDTRDGGTTWNQIMLSDPPNTITQSFLPGDLSVCSICGDRFYYDPMRMIVVAGDLNDGPVGSGSVRLSSSTDRGKTWKGQTLPFPSAAFAGDNVSPLPPVFFSEKDGLLPFGIIKNNPDMTRAYEGLAVYKTHDGGRTWITNSTVIGNLDVNNNVAFVSLQDMFAACDNDLCATHDGAHTWQLLHSNLNFGLSCVIECVTKIDFVNPTTGWAITTDGSSSSLWRTVDGGASWTKLSPILIP